MTTFDSSCSPPFTERNVEKQFSSDTMDESTSNITTSSIQLPQAESSKIVLSREDRALKKTEKKKEPQVRLTRAMLLRKNRALGIKGNFFKMAKKAVIQLTKAKNRLNRRRSRRRRSPSPTSASRPVWTTCQSRNVSAKWVLPTTLDNAASVTRTQKFIAVAKWRSRPNREFVLLRTILKHELVSCCYAMLFW